MKLASSIAAKAAVVGMLVFAGAAHAQEADVAGARVPLENYIKGHATGDGEYMRKAFHPDAKIYSFSEGKPLNAISAPDFAARFTGKVAPDEAQRVRRIESLDVVGNAGTAKIVLDYPNAVFTDYMNLLKIEGEWKIINKAFYVAPKKKG